MNGNNEEEKENMLGHSVATNVLAATLLPTLAVSLLGAKRKPKSVPSYLMPTDSSERIDGGSLPTTPNQCKPNSTGSNKHTSESTKTGAFKYHTLSTSNTTEKGEHNGNIPERLLPKDKNNHSKQNTMPLGRIQPAEGQLFSRKQSRCYRRIKRAVGCGCWLFCCPLALLVTCFRQLPNADDYPEDWQDDCCLPCWYKIDLEEDHYA